MSAYIAKCMVVGVLGLSACADDSESMDGGANVSVVKGLCQRFSECTLLSPGTGVEDCTQRVTKDLEDSTPNERADVETQIQECLDLRSCGAFADCAEDL
jgi:hypothetical protein